MPDLTPRGYEVLCKLYESDVPLKHEELATALGITKPNVASTIQRLENVIGPEHFDHSGSGIAIRDKSQLALRPLNCGVDVIK